MDSWNVRKEKRGDVRTSSAERFLPAAKPTGLLEISWSFCSLLDGNLLVTNSKRLLEILNLLLLTTKEWCPDQGSAMVSGLH